MKNKSFKNLVIGIGITNFGDSLFMIVVPIMIYAQTASDVYVSISASAAVFTMLFGFLLGPIINKLANRKWLIGFQLIQMVAITFVFICIFLGINVYSFSLIVFGLLIFSFGNYCSYILTQMIVPKIVADKELPKANSIVVTSRNVINGIADGISGILISIISFLGILIVDLFSYIMTFFFFRKVEIPESAPVAPAIEEGDNGFLANYVAELKLGFRDIIGNSFTVGILLFALMMHLQSSILAVTAVGFFSEADRAFLYGFYFASILIGFSLGSIISSKVIERVNIQKFLVSSYLLVIIIWIASMLVFKVYGLLIVVFVMAILSGIFEIYIVTAFQRLYKESFGNVMTLFMAISGVAQLLGLLLAPAFIFLLGYYNVIIYAALFNVIGVVLYLLAKMFNKGQPGVVE